MGVFQLVQTAGNLSKDILEETENELENYRFYRDFLEITSTYQLSITKLNKKRIGMLKIIEQTCKKLPPHLQDFVSNRYLEGHTMEKVAEIMNISTSTCYKYRRQVLYKFAIALGKC